jgi:hypothetical protein
VVCSASRMQMISPSSLHIIITSLVHRLDSGDNALLSLHNVVDFYQSRYPALRISLVLASTR